MIAFPGESTGNFKQRYGNNWWCSEKNTFSPAKRPGRRLALFCGLIRAKTAWVRRLQEHRQGQFSYVPAFLLKPKYGARLTFFQAGQTIQLRTLTGAFARRRSTAPTGTGNYLYESIYAV
jgi:hypothetical protein